MNEEGKDYRNTCWCKDKVKKLVQNVRHHFTGTLTCGGFYMHRLVKRKQNCRPDRVECKYLWMGVGIVEEEVLDLGFKYDFEPDTSHTFHQCTYMDGNMGIV